MSDDGPSVKQVAVYLSNLGNDFWNLYWFAKNPFRFTFGIISTYIVSVFLGLGDWIVSSVLLVFAWFGGAFNVAGVTLINSVSVVTTPLLVVGRDLTLVIASVVGAAGPLGPPIAGAFAAVLLYVGYRLLIAVAGEFPVGSTIVDLLRLR